MALKQDFHGNLGTNHNLVLSLRKKKDVLEISRTPQMFGRDSATQSIDQRHGQCLGDMALSSSLGSAGWTSSTAASSCTGGEASRASNRSSRALAISNMTLLQLVSCDNKKAGLALGRDRLLSTVSLLHHPRVTAKRNRPRFSQKKKPVINMKHMEMVVEICCINVFSNYQDKEKVSTPYMKQSSTKVETRPTTSNAKIQWTSEVVQHYA